MRSAWILLYVVAAAGCACSRSSPPPVGAPERKVLELGDVSGLSGIARGADGALWLAPERGGNLIWRGADGTVRRYAIEGLEAGFDVESIAYLGGDELALGMEANTRTGSDAVVGGEALVLRARIGDGVVTVTGRWSIDMAMWDLAVVNNEGVEGLCVAGDYMVAGIETVGEASGQRFAPVAVYRRSTDSWRAYRLRLSSAEGSLSALSCRVRDGALELVVIERHFDLLRVLRVKVPGAAGELTPTLAVDLDAFAAETGLNVEGVAIVGDGLVMVVDNHYKTISGPNELVLLEGAAR